MKKICYHSNLVLTAFISFLCIGLFSQCEKETYKPLGEGEALVCSFEGLDAELNKTGGYTASISPEGQQFSLSVVSPRCAWLQIGVEVNSDTSFSYPEFWSGESVVDSWGECNILSKTHPLTIEFKIPANETSEPKGIDILLNYANSFRYLNLTQPPRNFND